MSNNIYSPVARDIDTDAEALLSSQKLSDGSHALSVQQGAANAAAVSPSDSAALAQVTRAIYVGVSGDIKVDMAGAGAGILLKAVPVGMLFIQVAKIYATGTNATNLVALY
jgi:hypothetical protein